MEVMFDNRLMEILVCPWCLGELSHHEARLTCARCGAVYRIENDIPQMLVEEAELHCPKCRELLQKRGREATCAKCGQRFRMDKRLSELVLGDQGTDK